MPLKNKKKKKESAGLLELIGKLKTAKMKRDYISKPNMTLADRREVGKKYVTEKHPYSVLEESGRAKSIKKRFDCGTFFEGYRERGRRDRPEFKEGYKDSHLYGAFPSTKDRVESVRERTKKLRKTARKRRASGKSIRNTLSTN